MFDASGCLPRPLMLTAALSLLLLAACGGGGGSTAASPVGALVSAGPSATSAAAGNTTAVPASSDAAPAAQDLSASAPSNSAAVGTARALSAAASLAVQGVPDVPSPAVTLSTSSLGRQYFVDSQSGDDQRDGRSAVARIPGSGPWRSLARLMQADLGPGDTVNLACNSTWRETLRLPASGTAGQAITVKAAEVGCSAPPSIDGGLVIAPTAWARYSGNVYKTTLAAVPLQLSAASGVFTLAHHPNRGHLASDPASPYAALAADGNVLSSADGRQGSTVLPVGADLALPAGAILAPGTRVRVRTNSYIVDDLPLQGFDGNRITLAAPTSYPVRAGWGYFLTGQAWMLDSPGEWHHDASTGQLLAWMPDSAAPASVVASVLGTGIDLKDRQHVVLDGISVKRVGTGIQLRNSLDIQVRNCTVEDTADAGADAANSIQAGFDGNRFSRTGLDAIAGQGVNIAYAMDMTVRNNLVRDAGVRMQGEELLSLPRRNSAAISPGAQAVVTGNTVVNAAYIGIWALTASVVDDNFVFGACTVIDDCAGIYTGGADNNSQIRRNTIVHSRGAASGKAADNRSTQAQGIYLDDWTSGVVVEDNTVIDTDNGIFLHVANRNTVRNNRLFGNRNSQIWMQETPTTATASGELYGNLIEGNLIAPVSPNAVGLLLQTHYASTAAFGQFDNNRYYDRASSAVAAVSTPAGSRVYGMSDWRNANGAGSTLPLEQHGSAVSGQGYAAFRVAGVNLVDNANLVPDLAGWGTWNQTAPSGQAVREACAAGTCLRYTAGGSPGVVSSPNFSVQQGQWYRLTVDVAAERDNQTVPLVVRRGGGGTNGYESVSDRNLGFTAGRGFGRYTAYFQATRTIRAADPVTGDLGARVDIDGITAGQSLSLANLELVPITPDALAQTVGVLVNVGATASLQVCPYAGNQAALCGNLFNLADNRPVAWPVAVPARSALIVYAQEPSLVDTDGDGIPDSQDACPGTLPGRAVNARGCALDQR